MTYQLIAVPPTKISYSGVQAHDDAHRHDHFQVRIAVAAVAAADFGKQVGAAPAEQSGRESQNHMNVFLPI
jgi:hypothetical protein